MLRLLEASCAFFVSRVEAIRSITPFSEGVLYGGREHRIAGFAPLQTDLHTGEFDGRSRRTVLWKPVLIIPLMVLTKTCSNSLV